MDPSRPDLRSQALEDRRREFQAAGEEAEALTAGLTPRQLWWRPGRDSWSIGECLDHLVHTGEAYLEVLDEAIEAGRRQELFAEGPYRRTLVGRWLARILEPPPGLKVPAPRRIRPRQSGADAPEPRTESTGASGPETGAAGAGRTGAPATEHHQGPLPRFLALRPRLAERLAAADGLDLGRIRVPSPFVPLLRFDLGSAFSIIAAHERRHLWQARRVRDAEGFPRP